VIGWLAGWLAGWLSWSKSFNETGMWAAYRKTARPVLQLVGWLVG